MPELPEVEITARRLSSALEGAEVESALATGVATVKTFEPPLEALAGSRVAGVRRIGKMLAVDFDPTAGDGGEPLTLLIHLMSAGRLQLFDKRGSLRDRASRLLVRVDGERELRLREFGTKQSAWAKLLRTAEVARDESVATLGADAWPAPPLAEFAELIDQPRHLHPLLRHQRDIAGIGRSWVDEILWEARLSAFKQGSELDEEEVERLHAALHVLGDALEHYEQVIGEKVPDKLPMPLKVHRREGEPCPRCGTTIEAVFFAEHQTNYCPKEQTGGRVLQDRRLSRLLK
jgi:formamidopyrimidine-DNA glycosylase